jgi:hypothetical protein
VAVAGVWPIVKRLLARLRRGIDDAQMFALPDKTEVHSRLEQFRPQRGAFAAQQNDVVSLQVPHLIIAGE